MSETLERDERVTFKMRFILIWAIECERQFHIYTQESRFFLAFARKEFTKEQGYLGSLCASPYRLHCRESPIKANLKDRRRKTKHARNITFQSFFRHLTGFEDSKASLTSP